MRARATVLVVEDDATIRELIAFHLQQAGFTVLQAADAAQGLDLVEQADVVTLDWMLPDRSGLYFLRTLRGRSGQRVPVLMLTARAREAERVEGLDAGADDYLVKPFGAAELSARVRALVRRVTPPERVSVGPLRVDIEAGSATLDGAPLRLTPREYDLLAFLVRNQGKVFERSELLDEVWGRDYLGTERTVDQHVTQLRGRLGPGWIQTLRGRGYRFVDGDASKPSVG